MADAPAGILELVAKFREHRDEYKSDQYKETRLRTEFIDPFFEELGWDVHNKSAYAEAYKDVIHEDAIKVGGTTKAPDYCFRIGPQRKFFVEAKKPSRDIEGDPEPAYQLRRYAWSARLPLSILTDFEEFAVYDCRTRPAKTDKPSAGRTHYLTCDKYPAEWETISRVFSKDAVLHGSFDKYAASTKKRGTAEVDAEFLKEIEKWREALARNIALRNPALTVRQLNFAVQCTIDRIIFLRMCEDRGIEAGMPLQGLRGGTSVYPRLVHEFRNADHRYNSGLFHFEREKGREEPDTLTPELSIDDAVLKDIFKSLYYPECPYEFSVLPPDILGSVYEQFLGKVIHLTAGHRAKVEEKPEVKKAGGVYYTPKYIVDYIVEQTVGELLSGSPLPSGREGQACPERSRRGEGDAVSSPLPPGEGRERENAVQRTPMTPRRVSRLRILDPACGSGSFLVGAYRRLLQWHRDYYVDDGASKHRKRIYQGAGGQWILTTEEKQRILLNNIFGVDIDPQAVEVTKLNLLLCVLENENQETLAAQLALFRHKRALPDLASNIKCGNSLIGPDFYGGQQATMFDEEERYRINAFDWEREFPEIMKGGGFDVVIGNPPYGATFSEAESEYLRNKYRGRMESKDSFEMFVISGADLLSRSGYLSMIIPASWMTSDSFQNSRRAALQHLTPLAALAMPFDVFADAYIDTAIVVFSRASTNKPCLIHFFPKKTKLQAVPVNVGTRVPVANIIKDDRARFSPILSDEIRPILQKVCDLTVTFGQAFQIQRGVQPYSRKLHTEEQIQNRFLHASRKETAEHLPELQGSELARYCISPSHASYLRFCKDIASTRPLHMFQGPRLVLRRLLTRKFRLQAAMTTETLITTDNVLNLVPPSTQTDVPYGLGILNSRLISWVYVNTSAIAQKDDFPQVHISALSALGLPSADKARHDRMVELVEAMLDLHKRLPEAKTDHERTLLQRQIETTDRQIDQLVYELYGLTDEEIKIVEGT